MKKLPLFTLLLAASFGLKAQQLLNSKPVDSLSQRLLTDKYFKPVPSKGFALVKPSLKPVELIALNNPNAISLDKQDNMPIAVLRGISKMPVAKLGGRYNMPVMRIGEKDTTTGVFDLKPGLPASERPVK